jgi:hypothetical protein
MGLLEGLHWNAGGLSTGTARQHSTRTASTVPTETTWGFALGLLDRLQGSSVGDGQSLV